MKRILMILEREFPPDVRVEKEAITLTSLGHEIHVLSFNFGGKKDEEVILNGIHVHRFRISRQVFKKFSAVMNTIPLYQFIWSRNISRLLKKMKFDGIHVHDLPLCGTALKQAYKFGIPLIADMHENYPYLIREMSEFRHPLIKVLVNFPRWLKNEKAWLRSSTAIIATCDEMKKRLTALGLDPGKIAVVENTASLEEMISQEIVPDKDYVTMTYLGGINENRGLDVVIQGFSSIRKTHPKVRLWIVGDGKHRPVFEKMVKESGIEGVTFWGWKSREESMMIIQQSDICLIPHVKSVHTDNTSPNKIFEYFNAGKPVLASNCNYLVRILDETRAGMYYRHDSATEFEAAFYRLMDSDLNILGRNARNAVVNKYNWKLTAASLAGLYAGIFNKN